MLSKLLFIYSSSSIVVVIKNIKREIEKKMDIMERQVEDFVDPIMIKWTFSLLNIFFGYLAQFIQHSTNRPTTILCVQRGQWRQPKNNSTTSDAWMSIHGRESELFVPLFQLIFEILSRMWAFCFVYATMSDHLAG